MAKKITHEEYVKRLAKLGSGITVVGTYSGMGTKITHRCSCGDEWEVTPNSIKLGGGCFDCGKKQISERKLITHEEYVKSLAELDNGISVVGTYAGAATPIDHRCPEGHVWPASPSSIKTGHGCGICAGNHKKTHEEYVKSLAEMDNGITVVGIYAGDDKNITHRCNRCPEKHEWEPKPSNIKQGFSCPVCAKVRRGDKQRDTHENYAKHLAETGKGITAVGAYAGSQVKITHRCSEGHEWDAVPASIKAGNGCPTCATSASDANVFYIWENSEDAGVYKVGITSERIAEKRISVCTSRNSMKANIILMASVPDAREIERKALEMGEEVDYSSEIDGYTEFRRYTDQELGEVYRMAVQAA